MPTCFHPFLGSALAALYGRHLREFGADAAADIDDAATETSGEEHASPVAADGAGSDVEFDPCAGGGGDEAAPPGDTCTATDVSATPEGPRVRAAGAGGFWAGEPEPADINPDDSSKATAERRARHQLGGLGPLSHDAFDLQNRSTPTTDVLLSSTPSHHAGRALAARVLDGGGESPATPTLDGNKSVAAAALRSLAASPALSPARKHRPTATGGAAARFCGSPLSPRAGPGADGQWHRGDLVKNGWGHKGDTKKAARESIRQLLAPGGRATRDGLIKRAEAMARLRVPVAGGGLSSGGAAAGAAGDEEFCSNFGGGGGDESAPPGGAGDEEAVGGPAPQPEVDPLWEGADPADRFRAATEVVDSGRCKKGVTSQQVLRLHGLRRQGTSGDNTTVKPKGMFKRQSRRKWEAWTACKGTSNAEAQEDYALLVRSLAKVAFGEALQSAVEAPQLETTGDTSATNGAEGEEPNEEGAEEEESDKDDDPTGGDDAPPPGPAAPVDALQQLARPIGGGARDSSAAVAATTPVDVQQVPGARQAATPADNPPSHPASCAEAFGWCVKMKPVA